LLSPEHKVNTPKELKNSLFRLKVVKWSPGNIAIYVNIIISALKAYLD